MIKLMPLFLATEAAKLFDVSSLFSTLIGAVVGCIGSMIVANKTFHYQRKNNEVNALHTESVWRKDLYELSHITEVSRSDLELFRSCLSATRGLDNSIENYQFRLKDYDKSTTTRSKDLDDICLHCYYIFDEKINLNNNCSVKGFDNLTVFRFLCRLLLKSDWNKRVRPTNEYQINLEIMTKANDLMQKLDARFERID